MAEGEAQLSYPSSFLDIKTRVINNLRLDAVADLAKVGDAVNIAYSDVARRSRFFESSSSTAALVGGATSDTLPASLIELEDVVCTYGGDSPRLQEVSWEVLLDLRRTVVTGSGPPLVYSLRKNSLEFFPSAQGGEVLTYYGSTQPTALVADGDVPGIPEPFSKLLEYGASVYMAEFKNDILMLGNYQQQYQIWMGQFMSFCNDRLGTDALAFQVLPRGRRGYPPNDRSSDWYTYAGAA